MPQGKKNVCFSWNIKQLTLCRLKLDSPQTRRTDSQRKQGVLKVNVVVRTRVIVFCAEI